MRFSLISVWRRLVPVSSCGCVEPEGRRTGGADLCLTLTRVLSCLALALGIIGCSKPGAPPASPSPQTPPAANPAGPPDASPTAAQPRLPTMKIWLGPQELTVELARAPLELQTGMMFRTNMLENEGMLFVFPFPHRAGFWMKNTLIPLAGAYIDSEGVIQEIHEMKPRDETPIPSASDNIKYVLETREGWFQRNNVALGAVVRTERGSLEETFFGRRR